MFGRTKSIIGEELEGADQERQELFAALRHSFLAMRGSQSQDMMSNAARYALRHMDDGVERAQAALVFTEAYDRGDMPAWQAFNAAIDVLEGLP